MSDLPPIPSSEPPVSCVECGKALPADQMMRYGDVYVCAACKPVFMQKLSEGARLNTGAMNYAGVWTRFGAVFIDGIILQILHVICGLIMGIGVGQMFLPAQQNTNPALGPVATSGVILTVFFYIFAIAYETLFIGKWGATPGKMICKIKVVTAEGGQVSYLRALGRYFAKFLSGIILCIGYIMAAFDPEKRALHDRICNTRVIKR